MKVELPFPPRELSPNARVHWRVRARATAEYREACGWAAKTAIQQAAGMVFPLTPPVEAEVTFIVPDRRRRDLVDNLLASLKPVWDGFVDAGLLIDDRAGMLSLSKAEVQVGVVYKEGNGWSAVVTSMVSIMLRSVKEEQ